MSTRPIPADKQHRLLTAASALAGARDPAEASAELCATVFDVVHCARVYCLFHDAGDGSLWSEAPDHRECVVAGIVEEAITKREAIVVLRASSHPQYVREVDDPLGVGDERLLVQPIVDSGGGVHAVLIAVRPAAKAGFGFAARATMHELARYVAPMLEHLAHVVDADIGDDPSHSIFRREALDEYGGRARRGDVVRITPNWITPVSGLIAVFVVAVVAFFALGSVHRYSTGVGVLRATNRISIVPREAGTLATLVVGPGTHVEQGDVLARLDDADVRAEVERVEAQFLAELRIRMRNPTSAGSGQSIATLRALLEEARARVRAREIRAPATGTVIDVRSSEGQPIRPGDVVLTMSTSEPRMELVALLPGDDRPQIAPGMVARFQIPGYRHEPLWCRIASVSHAVVGPAEAARQLGPEVGDVVAPSGPSIIVRATVPASTFVDGTQELAFHDGMYGTVEVRLERESLAEAVFPGVAEALR